MKFETISLKYQILSKICYLRETVSNFDFQQNFNTKGNYVSYT